jgi:hypothetical protein
VIPPVRAAILNTILEAKRAQHPELRRQASLAGMRGIARRERVRVLARPHPRFGELFPLPTGWLLIVDAGQAQAAWPVIIAHELAHLWVHHDPFFERHETEVYDRSPEWYDAVREAEAEYVAQRMVDGPAGAMNAASIERDIPAPRSKRSTRPGVSSSLPGESSRANGGITRTTADSLAPVPDWLDEAEREADAVRLHQHATVAARAYARQHPPVDGPTIQFAINREAWQAIRFTPGDYPHYSNYQVGTSHEFVTCSIPAARSIVQQLAKAGHKRTAVFVRRRVREAEARSAV